MTIAFLVALVVLAVAYDIWVALSPTPGDTISEAMVYTGQHSSGAVLIIGIVLGHMLWPQVVYVRSTNPLIVDAVESAPTP